MQVIIKIVSLVTRPRWNTLARTLRRKLAKEKHPVSSASDPVSSLPYHFTLCHETPLHNLQDQKVLNVLHEITTQMLTNSVSSLGKYILYVSGFHVIFGSKVFFSTKIYYVHGIRWKKVWRKNLLLGLKRFFPLA